MWFSCREPLRYLRFFLVSQVPPDPVEVVDPGFAYYPFGTADGTFGEASSGFGIVAEIDSVGGGVEDEFVHAYGVAFAEGDDFEFFLGGFADCLLHDDRGAGGRVFLLDVVAFEDLAGVIEVHGGGGGLDDFEEEIYADGKVGAIKDAGVGCQRLFAEAREVVVPAGGADDDAFVGADAGLGVRDYGGGGGEVDDGIEGGEEFGGQGAGIGVGRAA